MYSRFVDITYQLRKTSCHTERKKKVFDFSFIHYNDKVLFHAIVRGFTISMLQISKKPVKNSICEDNKKQKYKMLKYQISHKPQNLINTYIIN